MNEMTDSASPTVAEAVPLVKACTKCGVEKLLVDFSPFKQGKFGRKGRCKACCRDYARARGLLPEVKKRRRDYSQRPENKERQRDYERSRRQRPDVKDQRRAYQRNYRQHPTTRERWRAYMRDYRRIRSQRPEVKELTRAYRQRPEYKEWMRAYGRAYGRDRRRNDLTFKLAGNLRNRLFCALKGLSKSARTLELVGCDIDFLRRWLEAKFLPGMTWENYGEWHVDHIMPCASFDLSDPVQQRTCFRWTNLQPLWAADNIRKSDNYAS